MNQPTIEATIYDYIEVNGRISKKLFEKVVMPKLDRIENLESQNKKLIEALRFYADLDNWEQPIIRGCRALRAEKILDRDCDKTEDGIFTGGKLARTVLKEVENESNKENL